MRCGTIEAEGLNWPIETFLDAHGFVRTDTQVPDFADHPGTLDVVTLDGELLCGLEAATIPWRDVLAAHAPDHSMKFSLCPGCGAWVVPVSLSYDDGARLLLVEPLCASCEAVAERDQ